MTRPLWYILDGRTPVPEPNATAWGRWRKSNNRRVAESTINGTRVSTVFLGYDHGYGDEPPMVFETMVFPDGSMTEQECHHYSTWDDAKRGHDEVVARLIAEAREQMGEVDQ